MHRKIRVLYVIPAEGFGGAERQALFHLRELPHYDVDIIAVTGPGKKVYNNIEKEGVAVHYCKSFPYEYGKPFNVLTYVIHVIVTFYCFIRTFKFLSDLVKKECIDIIFASRATGWILAAPIAKLFKIPCIWRFGSRVHGSQTRFFLRLFAKILGPDAAIANCHSVAESVKDVLNTNLHVIYNGIDSSIARLCPNKMDLSSYFKNGIPDAIIGMAVRPSPDKGLDFLSGIVTEINNMNRRIHVFIAGEFGWRQQIQEKINDLKLDSSITFLGYISDIKSFYNACDFIIMTSREKSIEGFPNALMEAMVQNKTVIATAVGGIPELIDDTKTGFLIHDMNPVTFAKTIVHLIDNPDLALKTGQNARNEILLRYSVENTVKPLAAMIKRIVQEYSNSKINTSPSKSLTHRDVCFEND